MERGFITYKGIDYPTIDIELSKISDVDSDEFVTIADCELNAAIEDGYIMGDEECTEIDNEIYFYCDSGFVASEPTEKEVVEYFDKYCL